MEEQIDEKIDNSIKKVMKEFKNFLGKPQNIIFNIKAGLTVLIVGFLLFLISYYIFKPPVDPVFIIKIPYFDILVVEVIISGLVGHPEIVSAISFFIILPIITLFTTFLLTLFGKIFEENYETFGFNFNKNLTATLYSNAVPILLFFIVLIPTTYSSLITSLVGAFIWVPPLVYTYEKQKGTGYLRSVITVLAVYFAFINIALTVNTILFITHPQTQGFISIFGG